MYNQAELDEFRIFKAQMDKHIGIQPRWTEAQRRATRKKSEIDFSKYNQIVVEDEEVVEHEYKYDSPYRGKVQNREAQADYQPMYLLSFIKYNNVVRSYQAFEHLLDEFNRKSSPRYPVYLSCSTSHLTEEESKAYFNIVEELTAKINEMHDMPTTRDLLLQRAVAYSLTQAYDEAINDLNTAIDIDSTFTLAYWQRAACLAQKSPLMEANTAVLLIDRAIDDLTTAIGFDPKNAYLYYDRANLYVAKKDYQRAIDDYTTAISHNASIPEVHYNRGMARIQSGNTQEGIQDLSRAGELGIYSAYSVIKKFSK